MTSDYWLVAGIVFLGVFIQSLCGFGSALVAMALLPVFLSTVTLTPLVALVAVTLQLILLMRYRKAFKLKAITPLIIAALFGIPLGVWALSRLNEQVFLTGLGIVITGYALYGLTSIRMPRLTSPAWAYLAGFLAGLLGGAYNTSGPPVVIYGDCRRWSPAEFKSNLQGFFLVVDSFVVINHAFRGNITSEVVKYYLLALPVIGLGIIAGTSLDRYLNPQTFRKLVLLLLVILGIRLLFFS